MKRQIDIFFEKLTKIETIISSLLIFLLTFFVILDVISREVFHSSIVWAQKLSVYLMIWAGFLGAVLMTQKAEHLRPEIAEKIWKGRGRVFYLKVHHLIVALFTIFMTYFSFQYVLESKEFGDLNVILQTPMWVLQLIIPYMFFSMSLRYSYFIFYPKDPKAIH